MVMSLSLSKLHFGLSATKNLLVVDNVMHYLRGAKHYENRNVLNLYTRGMFEDMFPSNSSNDIKDTVSAEPQCVYAGFDPMAGSLHVGNLLILKNLLHWQRSGHKTIILIGNGTAQVGDPSSNYNDSEQRFSNIIREQGNLIERQIEKIFQRHEKLFWNTLEDRAQLTPVKFVNNEDWYKNIDIVKFFNRIGRYFRMGTMMSDKNIHKRLNSEYGLCFTEFAYQIFQAYDWYYLHKNYDCKFQIGGADQAGNIAAGCNFIRRLLNKSSYGLILPLITNDAGDKFGKSVPNTVWLDPKLTSYFDFYQFFIRIPDHKVEKLLKLLTFLSLDEIKRLMQLHQDKREARLPQKKLAEEVTLLVHGEEGLEKAKKTTEAIYSQNIDAWSSLNIDELRQILDGATIIDMNFRDGYTLKELVMDIRCFLTEADAIRVSAAGGLYINLQKTKNLNEVISQSVHILRNRTTIVRGKEIIGLLNGCRNRFEHDSRTGVE